MTGGKLDLLIKNLHFLSDSGLELVKEIATKRIEHIINEALRLDVKHHKDTIETVSTENIMKVVSMEPKKPFSKTIVYVVIAAIFPVSGIFLGEYIYLLNEETWAYPQYYVCVGIVIYLLASTFIAVFNK